MLRSLDPSAGRPKEPAGAENFFCPFRGIVEETPNTTEHGRPSVMLEKYASATKMQPQSSGSLRSNAGIEKGKEIAARLNIHRIHSQLRGLDSTGWFSGSGPGATLEPGLVLTTLSPRRYRDVRHHSHPL